MPTNEPSTAGTNKRVLVTGANSGLGFEAAAQLAELGYGSVVLAARNQHKADTAKAQLVARTGRDVFETLVVDVSEFASSKTAAADLIQRGTNFDALLLNAAAIPSELQLTDDGLETIFASSMLGHHVLATELIKADRLNPQARVVIVGSEAANNDLPRAMSMNVFDFALTASTNEDGFRASVKDFARGKAQAKFDPNNQYATTKVISSWWSAEMQRRNNGKYSFFTVSPGSNMGTNAGRHIKGPLKIMVTVMDKIGHLFGMNQPTAEGARRYIDVLAESRPFEVGRTYTSAPKKLVGELVVRDENHLVDQRKQALAIQALDELAADAEAIQSAGR